MIWCVTHECSQAPDWVDRCSENVRGAPLGCRLAEALLIVKENGEWPEWVHSVPTACDWDYSFDMITTLDDLAFASVQPEKET